MSDERTQTRNGRNGVDDLLTIREAAAVLRISEVTLYRLRRRGAVPEVRFGDRVLFRAEALGEFIRSAERHSSARRSRI